MTTNAERARIATFLFLWLLKTETDFTTGCLSATEPALFEWSRSKCPFRFSFLTEVPQTGHFSVSNATPRFGLSPKKSIGYVASLSTCHETSSPQGLLVGSLRRLCCMNVRKVGRKTTRVQSQ